MKTIYRILGILAVMISVMTCGISIAVFQKQLASFPAVWNYWMLQIIELVLLLLTLTFAVLLFRPNLKRSTQLLWATVVVLLVASCISNRMTIVEGQSLAIVNGIPVIMCGVFSWLVIKKDQSQFYDEFKSKLNC